MSRLEDAWYALVQTWPILAARIRADPSAPSGLSYFIPQPATLAAIESGSRKASDPKQKHILLVDLSSRSISTYHPIVGKAVADALSRDKASVGSAPDREEQNKVTCANATKTFKELLKADQASVTAQATKWADATSVTISFNHSLGDAFSIQSIFAGWQETINGSIPEELQDVGKDPFIEYFEGAERSKTKGADGKEVTPGYGEGWKKFGFISKVSLIANLLWDIKVKRPEKSIGQYYIYLPEEKVKELLAQAKSDLAHLQQSTSSSSGDLEKQQSTRDLNVSTFNVLFAWLLQNIHAANAKPKQRSTVLAIVNLKARPPTGHVPSDYPAHQMWGGAFAAPLLPLTSHQYATLPIGEIALHIKESLKDQVSAENMHARLVTLLDTTSWKKPSKKLIFCAKPTDFWCGCTDWRRAQFGQVDFAAATADAEVQEEKLGVGETASVKPVAFGAHMEIPMTPRNRWVLFGEAGKGVWFSGAMTRKEARHEKGFGRYPFVQ